MTNHEATRSTKQIPAPVGRKSYQPPQLQAFGKLHLQTQGTGVARLMEQRA